MSESSSKVFVGFDGFIDRLARVVKSRDSKTSAFFEDIPSFATRINMAAGVSADLELEVLEKRPGGNAPILAHILAEQGTRVTCAGLVGDSEVHPVFRSWAKTTDYLLLGNPCDTLALEFDDGKIMLPDLKPLDTLTWTKIKNMYSDELKKLSEECELFALVNWSLLPHANGIWRGFRDDFLAKGCAGRNVNFFFDLADPSKHSDERIVECLNLISTFRSLGKVTLGLNENETRILYRAVTGKSGESINAMALGLLRSEVADVILCHPRNGCAVADSTGVRFIDGVVAEHPVASTGGGDAFNAGFCHGIMNGMTIDESVRNGIHQAYLYVTGYYGAKQNNNIPDDLIRTLVYAIEEKPERPMKVDKMAEECCVSLRQFNKMFKAYVGQNPKQYIINLRLKKAADLLICTDRSVADIALSIGYNDPLYFSRSFRKLYLMSPKEYRERHRN